MRPHLRRAALLLAITLPSLHAASIPQEEVALLHGQELPDLEPALLQAGAEEAKAEAEAERWRRPKYVPKMEDAEEAKLQALIRASEGLPYQEDVPAWPATGLTPAAQAPAAEEPATDGGDVEQSDMLPRLNGDNNLAAWRPQDTTLHVYYNDLSYPPAVREMSAVDRVYSMLSTPFATRGSHALLAINGVQPQTRDKRSRASSSVQSAFSWMCAVLFAIALAFTLFLGFRSSCIVMLTDAQRKDVELQPGIVENQGPDSGASKADVSTADTSAELWFGLDERWYVTIVAAGSAMVLDLYLNLVMTFLPIENRARGVSSAVTGLVFSLGPAGIVVASSVTPKLMSVLSPRYLLPLSTSCAAMVALGTGTLAFVQNAGPYTALLCIARIILGVATGLSEAVFTALLIRRFDSSELQKPISIVMASKTIASMGGPALGGAAYDLAGFSAPFAVGGLLVFCLSVAQFMIVGNIRDNAQLQKATSISKVLNVQFLYLVLNAFLFLAAWFMAEPIVAVWWAQAPYSLSPTAVGLISLFASIYGAFVLAAGATIGPHIGAVIMIIFASVLALVTSWVFAPAPFLPFIPRALWQLCLGVAGMTTAQNLTLPAIQPLLVKVCERRQLQRDEVAPLVAAANLMAFGMAGAIAPVLSGSIVDSIRAHAVPGTTDSSIQWLVATWNTVSFGFLVIFGPIILWDLHVN